ncbi:hypothetical protein R1flu_001299 [Riccia fluitans]|uniref:YDG domain-containing protein n=1 Tax=Riccia fluitans TaxID=41844 RepID=A0ABD1Y6W6_9MARC
MSDSEKEKNALGSNPISESAERATIKQALNQFHKMLEDFVSAPGGSACPQTMKAKTEMKKMYPDLKKNKNTIGSIKGISVGDAFGSRTETSVIGLHKELITDVNIVVHRGGDLDPIATSVVLILGSNYPGNEYKPGGCELVYCGEGRVSDGHKDKKLSAEDTALINSKDRDIPIRAIRCDDTGYKRYIYEGLYKTVSVKVVKVNMIYAFCMKRVEE